MLMGSLMSYGMGSMWGGHSMIPSYGGGLGMGGLGMGGGYYSDNDTNITNNYYNTPDPSASGAIGDAGQSQPAIEDVTDNQDNTVDSDNPVEDDVVDDTDGNQDDAVDNDYPSQDDVVEDADDNQEDVANDDYPAEEDVVDDADQNDTNQDYTNADDYGYGGDTGNDGYDYGGDDYGGGDIGGDDFGGGFDGGDFGGGGDFGDY
ncbi:hypothetical protein COOONC_12180 [Cooperia oncophora]